MTTYYPIYSPYGGATPGRYNVPEKAARSVATPVVKVRPVDDLRDLIGVEKGWLPKRERVSIDKDPARAILGEKADLGKMTVGALVYQIIQRERIKEENLTRIVYQEVEIDSRIMRIEAVWPEYMVPGGNRLKAGLEAELVRLEQQKRAEEVECWRDTSRLKQNLLELLGQYRDVARRYDMVNKGLSVTGAYTVK